MFELSVISFLLVFLTTTVYSLSPLIIDHTCTDISEIPAEWIDSVQANIRLHYAHTSHGSQLTTGLSRIETAFPIYNVARGSSFLPTESGAFCIFDGQEGDTYITPDEYWQTTAGMNKTRDVLNNNPTINISMWSWCCQLTSYSEAETQAYLDSITALETEFPDVVFIYMTCNAQATGTTGYNRYLRNEQIRQYCSANNKVLFDFADLDSWWFNPTTEEWELATYDYSGNSIPVEHTHFNGDEAGHTTYESCEQKGKAVWWIMAKLAGWPGVGVEDNLKAPQVFILSQNFPNPFNFFTSIRYTLYQKCSVELTIYDISGQSVRTLYSGEKQKGIYTTIWDRTDERGELVTSGVYFCQLKGPNDIKETRKMLILYNIQ